MKNLVKDVGELTRVKSQIGGKPGVMFGVAFVDAPSLDPTPDG